MSGHRQKETARLRSSCRYCRRRKIKCDGTSPCSACTTRRLDCVFEKQARMGRPSQAFSPADSADGRMFIEALYDIHQEMFLSHLPTSAFSVALQSYMHEKAPYLTFGEEELKMQRPCTAAVYDAILPMLVQEVIELCKFQFSRLGQGDVPAQRTASYLAVALVRDQSGPPCCSNFDPACFRLDDLKFHQLAQTWSLSHPLADCISLIDAGGDGPLNRSLRALITSEAMVMTGASEEETSQQFEQAHQHFYRADLPRKDDQQRMLLACQVSTLFAWNHISHTHAKHGIAFLALSCQLMGQLNSGNQCETITSENLKSLLSLMTVYAFSQLDRSSGCLSLPSNQSESGMALFYSLTAQMCSLLLNNHPDIYGISLSSIEDANFDILCDQLRSGLQMIPLNKVDEQEGQLLSFAVREILTLYLLIPRKATLQCSASSHRCQEVLARCSSALPLLSKLSNNSHDEENSMPLLRKVAFHRLAQGNAFVHAMRCTIVTILFNTLAEALQSILEQDETELYSPAVSLLSSQLLDVPMPLIIETQAVKAARKLLYQSKDLAEAGSQGGSASSVESILMSFNSSPAQEYTIANTVEPDLFEVLWGQLDWNFAPFDAEK